MKKSKNLLFKTGLNRFKNPRLDKLFVLHDSIENVEEETTAENSLISPHKSQITLKKYFYETRKI